MVVCYLFITGVVSVRTWMWNVQGSVLSVAAVLYMSLVLINIVVLCVHYLCGRF